MFRHLQGGRDIPLLIGFVATDQKQINDIAGTLEILK
jgi:hypothetical protein